MAQAKYTDPGDMRQLITFLDPGQPGNAESLEGIPQDPAPIATDIQARIDSSKPGREVYKSQQIVGYVTHEIAMRYQPYGDQLKSRMTVLWQDTGKKFRIATIRDLDGLKFELRIDAMEFDDGQ